MRALKDFDPERFRGRYRRGLGHARALPGHFGRRFSEGARINRYRLFVIWKRRKPSIKGWRAQLCCELSVGRSCPLRVIGSRLTVIGQEESRRRFGKVLSCQLRNRGRVSAEPPLFSHSKILCLTPSEFTACSEPHLRRFAARFLILTRWRSGRDKKLEGRRKIARSSVIPPHLSNVSAAHQD